MKRFGMQRVQPPVIRMNGRGAKIASAIACALLVASCGSSGEQKAQEKGGPGGQQGPATVGFVVVRAGNAPITRELSGRTAASATSEVRPQVNGLVRRRLFTEGSYVRAGQTLYQIDPRLYEASSSQAQANLQSAQANLEAARIRANRYRPLAAAEAVSQQDYTDALATQRQAQATVAQNQAALQTARVNLEFTRVPAPISGRIGRSLFTVGALVSTSQADPLAVIQQLDPMFVDIQQSTAELLALRRELQSGSVAPASARVRLKLEDGTDYPYEGTVQFAEVTVNESTGTVALRASFPNPQGLLLPGMFVRAVFNQGIDRSAIFVPQQAVSRDPRGRATVYVVGAGNKAEQRQITAERTQGAYWVVTQGLKPGDRVIVQGTANLKPGAPIRPVPANAPQRIAPPAKGSGENGGAGGGNSSQSKGG
jgi:membrane fusion protein (multidrug efflux system)